MSVGPSPGPWRRDEFGDLLDAHGVRVHMWETAVLLSHAPPDYIERAKANTLIAEAGPDLLAALAPFVAHNSSGETIVITVRTEDVRRARAAIAKATGLA